MYKTVIEQLINENEPMVLITILKVKGSAPRHAGSKMLLSEKGVISGTVGGGRGEALAIEKAMSILKSKIFSCLEVEMLGEDIYDKDMICGGRSYMMFQYIDADKTVYKKACLNLEKGKPAYLVTDLKIGETEIVENENNEAFKASELAKKSFLNTDKTKFYDVVFPLDNLLILGGGYVGQAVYKVVSFMDFNITVYDDREAFANQERFPKAGSVKAGNYEELLKKYPFNDATYVVITTRGHLCDVDCLRNTLNRPHAYLGCIGSRRKIETVKNGLLEEGFSKAKMASIYAPIGFDIGAETPEEIAIAILAQIIGVKNGKENRSL